MKTMILHIIKYLGIFWLTRKLIKNKTLILAYHGFEVLDESEFRPKVFIKPSTFQQRLEYLQKHCNVISLSDINKNKAVDNAVVITIDDGWASTLTLAVPLLNCYGFPHTVYLATEGVLAKEPIFHILLDFMLRESLGKPFIVEHNKKSVTCDEIDLSKLPELTKQIENIKAHKFDTELLRKIAKKLAFDIEPLIDNKVFHLMSVDEVKLAVSLGTDMQLHTHTHHTYLSDEEAFYREIKINRQHIEDITGHIATHHCYPSGSYNQKSIKYLKSLNIETATTCFPGLCGESPNMLELPRFLDGENIPQIVFEAEVSGILEVLRKLRLFFNVKRFAKKKI